MSSYIQAAVRRALSSLACLVMVAMGVSVMSSRTAQAQVCFSTDHKVSVGTSTGQDICHQSVSYLLNQTADTVEWPWADANDGNVMTFTATCTGTGVITSCSVSPTNSIDASGFVKVTFNTTNSGGQGTITVTVRDTAFGEFVKATALVTTPIIVSTAFTNGTDQSLARCAQGCFTAHANVSTPPYYSLDAARSVTLTYNGDRVRARPFVYADVAAIGDSLPHTYQLQVTNSAGARLKFTNGDTVLTFAGGSSGRLGGQLALDSTIATTPMAITVTVIANYGNGPQSQNFPLKIAAVNERNSPIAHGWTLAGMQHLYAQSSDSAVLITEGDGSAEVWTTCRGSSPCATSPVGDYSNLTWTGTFPGSAYVRAYPDSSKATFNGSGLLIKLADAFGNNDSMAYDGSNRLTAIYDPIRMNGSSRAAITLSYGATYGLASITTPGPTGSSTGGRTTTITVNASDSTLTKVVDPDGDSTMFGYDSKKRLSWVRDRRGDTTKYTYDTLSYKLISSATPPVSVDSGNGMNKAAQQVLTTTVTPWQIAGVPTAHTSTSSPAPLGSLSPSGYVIDPGLDTTSFTVNRWGEALVQKNALGVSQTVTIVDSNPVPQLITTIQGGQKHYTWTGPKLTSYQPPGGGTTNIYYNSGYNKPDSIAIPGLASERLFIGTSGRVDSIRYASSSSRMARLTYDSRGRVLSVSDIHGHTTNFHYDATSGNTDSVQAPGNRVTVQRFDGFGRDSLQWHNSTRKVTTLYDQMNRVTSVNDGVNANPTTTTYDGLFVTRTQDPKGQVHKYTVDALGRTINGYDAGDTTKFQSYRYNVNGLLTGITNRRGQQTQMTYDKIYRELTSVRSGAGIATQSDTFSYDNQGLRTVRWNSNARDSIFLDANGWTDSVVTHIIQVPQRYRIRYAHDNLVRLDSTLFQDSLGVQLVPRYLTYDSTSGHLASIALNSGTGLKTTFTYNTEFNLVSTSYPGSAIDTAGALTDSITSIHTPYRMQFSSSGLGQAMNQKVGYDSLGRIDANVPAKPNTADWHMISYTYDGLGRLAATYVEDSTVLCPDDSTYGYQCSGHPRVDTLEYDQIGNLTAGTIGGVSAAGGYKTGNRDTTLFGVTHTFDADGNVLTNGSTTYYWGVAGYLDSIKTAGGTNITYLYDAAGRPVKRQTAGRRDRVFLWDGHQLIAQLDSTGQQRIGEYVWLGGQPFAFVGGSTSLQSVSYYINDPLNSTFGLIKMDSAGQPAVREQYSYNEYGTWTTVVDSGLSNRILWKGMFYDPSDSTHLYYVHARWYDPQQGRFMNEDPIGIAGGLNQYAFAGGDPINRQDATGQCGTPDADMNDGIYGWDLFTGVLECGNDPSDSTTTPNLSSDSSSVSVDTATTTPGGCALGNAPQSNFCGPMPVNRCSPANLNKQMRDGAKVGAVLGVTAGFISGASRGAAIGETAGEIIGGIAGIETGPGDIVTAAGGWAAGGATGWLVGGVAGAVEGLAGGTEAGLYGGIAAYVAQCTGIAGG